MNKKFIAATMILACSAALCGCAKKPKTDLSPAPRAPESRVQADNGADGVQSAPEGKIDIKAIVIEKTLQPISGVKKHWSVINGEYKSEYIHSTTADALPEYTISFNDDTFNLKIEKTDGVTEHYGHYYVHCDGNITMFYDDPVSNDVCDFMYGELLPSGKIMIYDESNVVILAGEQREWATLIPRVKPHRFMPLPIGARYYR